MSNSDLKPATEAEVVTIPSGKVDGSSIMEMMNTGVANGAPPEHLERLMALYERWEAQQAKRAYIDAMMQFRELCPSIIKTRTGHNNAKYAGLPETVETVKSLLAQCGLSHAWDLDSKEGLTIVTCRVTHIGGHSESVTLMAEPDKTGSKNSVQAIGSTVTYLQRYTLSSILGLAATDKDDDGKGAAGGDAGLSARRHEVYGLLTERFSADGPAIVKWLADKKLAPVRTATPAQLDAIEKALKP